MRLQECLKPLLRHVTEHDQQLMIGDHFVAGPEYVALVDKCLGFAIALSLHLVACAGQHQTAVLQLRFGRLGPVVASRACKKEQSKAYARGRHQVGVDFQSVPERIDVAITCGAGPLEDRAEQYESVVSL
jgi:hypothetical protein